MHSVIQMPVRVIGKVLASTECFKKPYSLETNRGDQFSGRERIPNLGVPRVPPVPEIANEMDCFVRSTNRGFVTLKVRIVAVEEKAFQSVGLEHDRIGHSFSHYLKACPRTHPGQRRWHCACAPVVERGSGGSP